MKVNTNALENESYSIRKVAFQLADISHRINQVDNRLTDASVYRLMHHAIHLKTRQISELSDKMMQMGIALSRIVSAYEEAEIRATDETENLPTRITFGGIFIPRMLTIVGPDGILRPTLKDIRLTDRFGEPSGVGGGGSW